MGLTLLNKLDSEKIEVRGILMIKQMADDNREEHDFSRIVQLLGYKPMADSGHEE